MKLIFSPSGGPGWSSAGFCSGSSFHHTHATMPQPPTCGASLDVQSASSPSRPRNLAAGACTSPPMPAGGAARPGRWAASVLYPQRVERRVNVIKLRGAVSKADNFTQKKINLLLASTYIWRKREEEDGFDADTDGQMAKYRDRQIGSETNSVDGEMGSPWRKFVFAFLHPQRGQCKVICECRQGFSCSTDTADRQTHMWTDGRRYVWGNIGITI